VKISRAIHPSSRRSGIPTARAATRASQVGSRSVTIRFDIITNVSFPQHHGVGSMYPRGDGCADWHPVASESQQERSAAQQCIPLDYVRRADLGFAWYHRCMQRLPFSLHDPRWYRRSVPSAPPSVLPPALPPLPRRRYRFTVAECRRGGVTRAASMTAMERSVASMRAVRVRWTHPRWASAAVRRRVALALVRARRGEAAACPMPGRVPLIPAKPPPPRVWHPSMMPRPCERCGGEDAAPYQRAPLLTCNWVWRCPQCAFAKRADL
jgi:hypothetical protein